MDREKQSPWKRLVVATGNQGKWLEVGELLADLGVEALTAAQAGLAISVQEDGSSYGENALRKARAIASPDHISLADDSGLEIDALGGEPGLYSARFMGEDTPARVKNAAILERMAQAGGSRRARFVCAIALIWPDGEELVIEDSLEGHISEEMRGEGGFGYDPIFCPLGGELSLAQMDLAQKNRISHRGKALARAKEEIGKRCER